MILYKNVDVCDLTSIMEKGILSLKDSGNDNWDEGKRAQNDTSVVYLFSPTSKLNSFPGSYGIVLLECECDAIEIPMDERDIHKNNYKEYITSKVDASKIKRVIIPKLFRDYITVPKNIDITWCDIKADCYSGDLKISPASQEIMERFAKTASLEDASTFNFFRGFNEDRTVIDLYNIQYIF